MTKIKGKRNIWIGIGIILFFMLLSVVYFSPILKGQRLKAQDHLTYQGMSKEISDYRASTGKEALWTNSMFGGMPAYLISVHYPGNLLAKVKNWLQQVLPLPANLILLNFVFFYLMGLLLGFRHWTSALGALMYGLMTFFFVVAGAGHYTKVATLCYAPIVLGGVIFAYRSRPVAGSLIAAGGLSWMISANHPQMSYYVGWLIVLIGIAYLIDAIQTSRLKGFLKTSVLLLVGLILAVGTNYSRLSTTYVYSHYSTRGKSDLTSPKGQRTGGLDTSYILDYSYDVPEALTAFIPRIKGGGMAEPVGTSSSVYQFIKDRQGASTARRICQALPLYWGSQPIVSAPFYFGAVLCFFFVFGLFVVSGRDKWWIVAAVIIAFLLSLGKNFSVLSDFMIHYFPGYNKFRDVKNIIVIQQLAMAIMGLLAMRELFLQRMDKILLLKKLKYSWLILGGLALLFFILPGLAGDFRSSTDVQLARSGWPSQLLEALRDDRRMVLRHDALRSLIFVSLTAGLVWLYVRRKIKIGYAIALTAFLILIDMWPVDRKYLNNDQFESLSHTRHPYQESVADRQILKDPSPDYRVLNLTVSVFQDASTSYFHKSIGGYHGAKMERYQELYEHELFPEIQHLINGFKHPDQMDSLLKSSSALNMLNTKYLIYNPKTGPLINSFALGNAWFVNSVKMVADADEEMAGLKGLDAADQAVVDQKFGDLLTSVKFGSADDASIHLIHYEPNRLTYQADVGEGPALAVFSEIYYPAGWHAYIDGTRVDYLRANYVLRALVIPRGKHEIEFRFEPRSYFRGNKVAYGSSAILILLILALVFAEYKKRSRYGSSKTDE